MLGDPRQKKAQVVRLLATLVVAAALLSAGCSGKAGTAGTTGSEGDSGNIKLRVLFAGSLIIPFAEVEKQFEAANPGVDVYMEGHGSIQAMRIVGDLHEPADLVISADYRLIPLLLYQSIDPDTKGPFADWSVMFATNRMALAYTAGSRYAAEVTADNWFDVINRDGVRLGISDPRMDANGYRAMMAVRLAEDFYAQKGLFVRTFGGQFTTPVRVTQTDQGNLITIPEILETKSSSHIVLRPYSVNLLPLLQAGEIDYAFEYESVIRQHGLQYVTLPPQIDLSDPAESATYSTVSVKLDYQRFASVKPEFIGEPIRYGATIPSNCPHPKEAAELLAFILGSEGQSIMAQNYQPMIVPALTDNYDKLPDAIRALCKPVD
jgi:molybdate/tungstate transport system substrate-binding protein